MNYLITFLEGIITFISPCVLPMLPVYLAYFAQASPSGTEAPQNNPPANPDRKASITTLLRALAFSLGFTVVFVLLGVFSGSVASLFARHRTAVNIVCGSVVVLLGLHYTGLVRIPFLDRTLKPRFSQTRGGLLSSALLGVVFAVGWSPCTGAFLGSALMLAAQSTSRLGGMLLLLAYSAGLALPFIGSALFMNSLTGAVSAIRRHYRTVNILCGAFLIVTGILMMTGVLARLALLL